MITGKSIITEKGASLEAAAIASGVPVVLTHFVVGDGGGGSVVPLPSQTQLVNEVYRGAITRLFVTPEQRNQIVAHLKLPSDIGGFVVREVGLLTAQGELYAVSSCPAIEKPDNGVIIQLQFRLAVSSTEHIDLTVLNGDGVFLRIDYALSEIAEQGNQAQAIDNLGLRQTVELAANAVPSSRRVNGMSLTQDITITTITGNAGSATKLQTARKINGVPFDGTRDIALSAGQIGAYTKAESDARYVKDVRLGAEVYTNRNDLGGESFVWRAGLGFLCSGFSIWSGGGKEDNFNGMYSRPVQKLINGTWYNVASL